MKRLHTRLRFITGDHIHRHPRWLRHLLELSYHQPTRRRDRRGQPSVELMPILYCLVDLLGPRVMPTLYHPVDLPGFEDLQPTSMNMLKNETLDYVLL